jgi:hypothetical protein
VLVLFKKTSGEVSVISPLIYYDMMIAAVIYLYILFFFGKKVAVTHTRIYMGRDNLTPKVTLLSYSKSHPSI